MPVYGFPDRASYDRMASAVRQSGDLPLRGGRGKVEPGTRIRIGKPATNFAQGVLSAPDNQFNLWRSPAHPGDDWTNRAITVHYARVAVTTADYCVAVKIGGYWHIEKLTC